MRALLACAACLLTPASALAQTAEHTISVLGTGRVEVRPDRGSFSVSVTELARSADRARGQANGRTEAIVRGLRRVGVDEDDLTTSRVSISRERFRPRKDAPLRTRFRANVTLRVSVNGLGRLGRAIDAASRRGATDIYGPQLSFSAERRADGERRSASVALDDARARAEAAAAQEGQRIVDVQSIDLDPGQGQYAPFAYGRAALDSGAGANAPTRIRSAVRKVTSRARVTYVIEPAE